MQTEINQHKVFMIGFSLIALVILWFLLKPLVADWRERQKNKAEQKASEEILKAPSTMPENLFSKIQDKSKIFLVDISNPDDFNRGHIAASVNVQADKIDKNYFAALGADKAADIFVINQGSDLADLATIVNRIISQGFANTKYLRGGIPGWQEKGYPLVSSGGSDADSAKVKKITIDELKQETIANPETFQFLDLRTRDDFLKEHIVEALNIPLSELETRKNEISPVKKIVVYGSNENEGFQGAVVLFDLNFFNVYQMEGGIDEWKSAGGKTASGN